MAKKIIDMTMVVDGDTTVTVQESNGESFTTEGKVIMLTEQQQDAILAILNPLVGL